ncbi:MAG: tetratricopeptide repeat protein [Opitutaceae bacterium]
MAALVLFLTMRRVFCLPGLRERFGEAAGGLSAAVAMIWALHPIQTAAVTYVSQRAESLMGLFYLLTLYCFVRGATAPHRRKWHVLAVISCWVGMATKEVMVTAPLMILLFDRTLVADRFASALRMRKGLYLGLAAAWLLLGALMVGSKIQERGINDGQNFSWWSYGLTQLQVVPAYLKLCLWPHPLIFDYDVDRSGLRAMGVIAGALVVAAMVGLTVMGLRRRRVGGLVGAWFLLLLVPTSSIVPINLQPMAESRVYLPLAAVVAGGVALTWLALGRRALALLMGGTLGLMVQTHNRNAVYSSEVSLWADTVAKRPQNARAQNAYGAYLLRFPNRIREAVTHYEAAVRLKPDFVEAHDNLGNALRALPAGQERAEVHYREALRQNPRFAQTHSNLGNLLATIPGRLDEAIEHHREAVRLQPTMAELRLNLGLALARNRDRTDESVAEFKRALAMRPVYPEAMTALAGVLAENPAHRGEAIGLLEQVVRNQPRSDIAHYNLGTMLFREPGRNADALALFETALSLNPDNVEARISLGAALLNAERIADAVGQSLEAVRRAPQSSRANFTLGAALLRVEDRRTEGLAHIEIASRLDPNWEEPKRALEAIQTLPR